MRQAKTGERTAKCLTSEGIYAYLERRIGEEERSRIQSHLDECTFCYEAVVSLLRNSLSPVTERERSEIDRLTRINPEQQVARVLSYVEAESQVPKEKERQAQGLWERLSLYLGLSRSAHSAWKPVALASLALLLLVMATYQGVRYYNTTLPIAQAQRLLQENYRVYMKDTPRLSGGYRSSGVQVLMAGEETGKSEMSYSEKALALTRKASAHGGDPNQVRQIEAQVHFIQNDVAKAESVLRQVEGPQRHSAPLLNDHGVFSFRKQDWAKALEYFEAATAADPNFRESWYNLALVKAKRNDSNGALRALNQYLTLETDEGWRNAALEFKKRLK